MTAPDLTAAAAAIVERTRAEQGKPRYIEDPPTLASIARVMTRRPRVVSAA